MKILFIADKSIVGGATVALINILCELKKHNTFEVAVVTVVENDLNRKLDSMGVYSFADHHVEAMQEISKGRLPIWIQEVRAYVKLCICHNRSVQEIEKKINVSEYDIIHTNSARTDIGCYLAVKYNKPHIMHIREFGTLDYGCKYIHPNYIKFLNKTVNQFIALSDAVKKYWISIGLEQDKIVTIYDGVNAENYLDVEHNYQDDILKMVCIGSIRKSKGQYQIIEALGKLPSNIRSNVSLSLYGWSTESYIDELKRLAKSMGVDSQVAFCGVCDNVPQLLNKFDVGITASKSEGFGLVTNEYMLSRLGVIAANTGASPELIHHKDTGLIYEFGNSEDLAVKIQEFYLNRDLLKNCSNNAKNYALKYFTSAINAENIIKVYRRCLEEQGDTVK